MRYVRGYVTDVHEAFVKRDHMRQQSIYYGVVVPNIYPHRSYYCGGHWNDHK